MRSRRGRPEQIGRYEVRGNLGGGGMGDVFRVFDPVSGRELALKVLKFTYPRALHYFKREFRAVAGLSHPNLVALYKAQEDADGWLATGHLPGLRNNQPLGAALGYEIQVAVRDAGTFMDPRSHKDWWR